MGSQFSQTSRHDGSKNLGSCQGAVCLVGAHKLPATEEQLLQVLVLFHQICATAVDIVSSWSTWKLRKLSKMNRKEQKQIDAVIIDSFPQFANVSTRRQLNTSTAKMTASEAATRAALLTRCRKLLQEVDAQAMKMYTTQPNEWRRMYRFLSRYAQPKILDFLQHSKHINPITVSLFATSQVPAITNSAVAVAKQVRL
jgi:hypothetical protein